MNKPNDFSLENREVIGFYDFFVKVDLIFVRNYHRKSENHLKIRGKIGQHLKNYPSHKKSKKELCLTIIPLLNRKHQKVFTNFFK